MTAAVNQGRCVKADTRQGKLWDRNTLEADTKSLCCNVSSISPMTAPKLTVGQLDDAIQSMIA